MSSKPKILVQLDSDSHASVFDAVVAIDSGVDHLLQYRSVAPEQVRDLVHGAMFTRGTEDLKSTAVFIGGSNVAAGEQLLKQVAKSFFGPIRVSVMLDANGANTTAAAAVIAATRHLDLANSRALVLAGTGPVGQRAARLLARAGADVLLASRSLEKSESAVSAIRSQIGTCRLAAVQTATASETEAALTDVQLVIAAGAAGIELVSEDVRRRAASLKVAIDLNAVPPLGVAGVDSFDKGKDRGGLICYGALGVGGRKMKIHKAAVRKLFTANDLVLDAEQIFALGLDLAISEG